MLSASPRANAAVHPRVQQLLYVCSVLGGWLGKTSLAKQFASMDHVGEYSASIGR